MSIEPAAGTTKALILCGAIHGAARFRRAGRSVCRNFSVGCNLDAARAAVPPPRSIGYTPAAAPRTDAYNFRAAGYNSGATCNLDAARAAVEYIGGNACRLQ